MTEPNITASCGNVFRDLELPDADNLKEIARLNAVLQAAEEREKELQVEIMLLNGQLRAMEIVSASNHNRAAQSEAQLAAIRDAPVEKPDKFSVKYRPDDSGTENLVYYDIELTDHLLTTIASKIAVLEVECRLRSHVAKEGIKIEEQMQQRIDDLEAENSRLLGISGSTEVKLRVEIEELALRTRRIAAMFDVPDGGRYLNDWQTKADKLKEAK